MLEVPMFAHRIIRAIGLTAAVLVPAVAHSQTGTVTGTVTEARASQPVAGARVQALSATTVVAATQSRDDGSYRLTVAPGTYTIVVNRIGYRPGNTSVTVTAGGSATADVQLAEAVIELNPVVTVASRKEEKALDAPASVAVIEVRDIQERPSVTAADHVQGVAGVDVSKGGIAQSNIVARGFNNVFSGSMLTLQDYRFAGVPSLRVNVPLMSTTTNDDIERIEVLLGPASALYGPNSSHGVLHVITKSPFTSQGTSLSVDGGTHSLFKGAARHAGLIGDKFGFKVSGEYFTAQEFKYQDPAEPAVFPDEAPEGRRGTANERTFDIQRTVGEARVDYRPTDNSEYVTTFGISKIGSAMELTGTNGAVLAKNWTYMSLQQRARIGRLFGQVFMNTSNSGNDDANDLSGTYSLRTGQPFVDQSRVLAAQVQHGLSLGARQDFVYGVDYIATSPRTLGTINGRNEDIDDVSEIGGYVQSTSRLTSKLDFVAAIRVDRNDQVDGLQTSPRAAIILKPSETQNFRLTYNRAFQTPANFTWFLDLISARNLSGLPYNIRAVGNPPKQGWTFRRDCDATVNGGLCMRTIFTGPAGENTWVPASAAVAYQGAIAGNAAALTAGLAPAIQAGLQVNQATAQAVASQLITYLAGLAPTAAQVGTQMRFILPGSPNMTADDVKDIAPIKASFNNTWELGYKGIIGNRLRLAVDAWREKRGDVGNPAGLSTPNIFFDSTSMKNYMQAALIPAITQALMGPPFNMSQQQAAGTAQVFAPQVAAGVANGLKPLPLGIVSFNSESFASARDILATYTSYDATVTVSGVDLAVDFVANDNWTLGGTLSWVSDDVFEGVTSSNSLPLMLNAPTNKLSLSASFRSTDRTWGVDVRNRYTNSYPVNSGVYATGVEFLGPSGSYMYEDLEAANVLDLQFNWRRLFGTREVLFSIRADNVLDQEYRTMPGAPLIGRLISTRWQYAF
jgi:iron complex outermembrane receptor protein